MDLIKMLDDSTNKIENKNNVLWINNDAGSGY